MLEADVNTSFETEHGEDQVYFFLVEEKTNRQWSLVSPQVNGDKENNDLVLWRHEHGPVGAIW